MEPVNDHSEELPLLPEEAAAWLVKRRVNLVPRLEQAGSIIEPIEEIRAVLSVMLEAENDGHRALVQALCSLYTLELDAEAYEARIEKLEAQMAVLKPNWRADA